MKNKFNTNNLKRDLSFFSAFILVVANMIGTGIYTTSGFIIKEVGNPQTMLLCWFVGGFFALSGVLCYGELGAMFPESGGEYVFLRKSFGKGMAFLSGWISLIVGFSAPIAAASVAFSTYSFRALPFSFSQNMTVSFFGVNLIVISPVTITAVAVIIIFSLIHYHGLFVGSRIQNGLTLFKISLITTFIVAGLLFGQGSTAHFSEGLNLNLIFSDKFAISLIFISFAYSGWNAAAYLGGEIKNPERNIPLSLLSGTLFVMFLYLFLNIVFIYALPVKEMSGVLEIGERAASALFGGSISKYFTVAIAIGILSAVSAMIMTGPRVYYAMSKDGMFFELFGKVSKLHKTPAYSIFFQALVAVGMVVTLSFEALLLYIGITLSLFATMTVVGMMLLRIRRQNPSVKRVYKTFGYPVTPLFFILGNLWIIYFSIKSRPIIFLFAIGTIGMGCLVYLYFNKRLR